MGLGGLPQTLTKRSVLEYVGRAIVRHIHRTFSVDISKDIRVQLTRFLDSENMKQKLKEVSISWDLFHVLDVQSLLHCVSFDAEISTDFR